MDNDDFFSRNCYGGGKKKRNDSDLEYDPEDAKKHKVQKRNRKKIGNDEKVIPEVRNEKQL